MEGGAADLGIIEDGALVVSDERLEWVGPVSHLPPGASDGATEVDAGGRWATPGLVDCHTHLVFGGNRADEFRMRLAGATYEEIARAGGGILSTVSATRAATDEALYSAAKARLQMLIAGGVTTVEVKSGYGLGVEAELRMLGVARQLADALPVTVRTTLLGAHALPAEYLDRRSDYIRLVCEEMIPRAAREGLADAVDAFCESIAFTSDECRTVLEAGRAHGLALRLHADQLSDAGGAALAAELRAASADHVEYTSAEGARAMAEAGTVAVLLPGAFFFLREDKTPPIAEFREHAVAMAVATDLNPGSSPLVSPTLALNLACVQFRLTPAEALAGMTIVAARVLGLEKEIGSLEPGKAADISFWNVDSLDELVYWIGAAPCAGVMKSGRLGAPLR
jgi:imidazolonepropionase